MSMTDLVLADGQTPPVSHVFTAVTNVGGVFTWEELNPDAAVGNRRITMSLRQPTNGSSNYKATIKVWNPKLEVTSPSTSSGYQPAPKVAYTVACTMDVTLPQRSARTVRLDEHAFMVNVLNTVVAYDLLVDFVTPI